MSALSDILAATDRLTDQDRLLLIDAISDQCDDDVRDALFPGFVDAFALVEAGRVNLFAPTYPAGCVGLWDKYTADRNLYLTRRLRSSARRAA